MQKYADNQIWPFYMKRQVIYLRNNYHMSGRRSEGVFYTENFTVIMFRLKASTMLIWYRSVFLSVLYSEIKTNLLL